MSIQHQLNAANTQFGVALFKQLVTQTPAENIFLSPFNIASILALTCNGARGETQTELQAALQLTLPLSEVNEAYLALIQAWQARTDVILSIANGVWGREPLALKAEFQEVSHRYYQAEVQALDFAAPTAAPTINQWVSDQTQGKITQIVPDPIPPLTLCYLISAIYFKANWASQFSEANSTNKEFHLANGQTISHPRMSKQGQFKYLETATWQAIRLPYQENLMSMVVVLPHPEAPLIVLYDQLNPVTFTELVTALQSQSEQAVYLELPKFKLNYSVELIPALQALGIAQAFNQSAADFGNLTNEPVYISKVLHKSFVEVNEVGTEAAAATSVAVSFRSSVVKPKRMVIDRPFFFAIIDDKTQAILFMANVVDPQ